MKDMPEVRIILTGNLSAKQTSINPNFASLIVHFLKELGVGKGDVVAANFSGSFPALNICVLAALQTLKVNPVIICSASASQWGANFSGFLRIDMETLLNAKGIFRFRSVAASMGGLNDRGEGMMEEGREMLVSGIRRKGLPFINPKTIEENLDLRMGIYHQFGAPKAFINIGGAMIPKRLSFLCSGHPSDPRRISPAPRIRARGI